MLLNRKCNYCGSEYYICRSCIKAGNAWKNVCCSKECFMNMIKEGLIPQEIPKATKEVTELKKILLRGELKNGITEDIVGYDIDLLKFDCTDGNTYNLSDFKFIYVPSAEFEDIIKNIKKNTEKKIKASKKADETPSNETIDEKS